MLRYFGPALVGLSLFAMTPIAEAQRGGGGRGGGGGGHAAGAHVGGAHVGGAVHGGSFHGGNFHGGNFHDGRFNGGIFLGVGPGWGWGGWGGWGYGGWGYPPYGGYYDYGYAAPYAATYSTPYVMSYPPVTSQAPADSLGQSAGIDVLLPRADAQVFVDGNPMTAGSGMQRSFVSPPLESGYSYAYKITATWMDNGQQVRAERMIAVAPGRVSRVDFSSANVPKMPAATN
jgi:uncharacterized protein (TIGR03000 family)